MARLVVAAVMVVAWACPVGRAEKPSGSASDTSVRLVVDPTWPRKPPKFEWGQMPGIAVDVRDRVHIFTRNEPAVQLYRPDGTFLRAWNIDGFAGAHYIRIGPKGNVWTTSITDHVVRKHSRRGKVLLTLGRVGRAGTDEKHFDRPTDVAVLPSGDIFVSDGYGNRRIIHFDRTGAYVNQWGAEGTEPGQFALPHAIAADSQNRLYVADRDNARIQVFDTTGKLLEVWANLITPWGLHVTGDDEIWVCGSSPVKKDGTDEWMVTPPPDQMVMKLNAKGKVLLRLPLPQATASPGKPGRLELLLELPVSTQQVLELELVAKAAVADPAEKQSGQACQRHDHDGEDAMSRRAGGEEHA